MLRRKAKTDFENMFEFIRISIATGSVIQISYTNQQLKYGSPN